MRRIARLLALIALAAIPARADEIVVFAAASLQTALDAATADFVATVGTEVAVSYAGSSQLARQILAGAPADIFLSANTDWMDALDRGGRLAASTRSPLLGNRLVLIASAGDGDPVDLEDPEDLADRLGTGHLAMALVDAVPAGIYGRAALHALGLWSGVEAQVAQTDNVRAALALVATGAAPLGIVYASDALAEPRVRVVARFPDTSHPPIVYPVAIVAGHDRPATRALLDHLNSPAARAVFEAQGFNWLGD